MFLGHIYKSIIRKYKKRKMIKEYKKNNICVANYVDLANCELGDYVNLAHHSQISNSIIGERTSVGRYSKIQFSKIGKFCSISWDVTIGAIEHPLDSVSTHAFSYRKQFGLFDEDIILEHKEINIGNDVWIGAGAIILSGVNIGDGSVIGAGSVVTHDVAPYEIVAGCPAKHLRYRFNKQNINELLKIKWWDFPQEEIKKNIDIFNYKNNVNKNEDIIKRLLKISETCNWSEEI